MTIYLNKPETHLPSIVRKPGKYYLLSGGNATSVNRGKAIYSANRLIYYPIIISQTLVTNELIIRVRTVTGTAPGAQMNWGIYSSLNGEPDKAIFLSGSVDCTVAGNKVFPVNLTINPGLYWIGYIGNDGNEEYVINTTDYQSLIGVDTGDIGFNNIDVKFSTLTYQLLPQQAIIPTGVGGRDTIAVWFKQV